MASCGLVRWPTHGQGASRELISSCRSAGVVSKQHHGPHHCCGRRRSNAEFESLCSRFVEHASTCTTQPLRSMVSATSMRKRRRGALREAPGSDSVRVPRAAHSSPVKLSIAYALRKLSSQALGDGAIVSASMRRSFHLRRVHGLAASVSRYRLPHTSAHAWHHHRLGAASRSPQALAAGGRQGLSRCRLPAWPPSRRASKVRRQPAFSHAK